MMTPTQYEKNEWSRMAQAAYSARENAVGHRYSVAASLPHDGTVTAQHFDRLQEGYRLWLVWNDFRTAIAHCNEQRAA